MFCKPPKAAVMTVVREFYVNALESPVSISMVRKRPVKYNVVTITAILKIQNAPHGPNQVAQLDSTVDLDEVIGPLCDNVATWTMVKGTQTAFLTKELWFDIKIWHHFTCAQLMPTVHLTEVTRDQTLLLYGIKKRLTINVGHWISANIRSATQNVSIGIPHLTLVTELIDLMGLNTRWCIWCKFLPVGQTDQDQGNHCRFG